MARKVYGVGGIRVMDVDPGDMIRAPEFGIDQWMRAMPVKDRGRAGRDYRVLVAERPLPDGRIREVTTDPLWNYDMVEVQVESKGAGGGSGFAIGVAVPLG